MQRRNFLGAGAAAMLAPQTVLGANDRVRVALIGAGGRGRRVADYAQKLDGAEVVAVSDIYAPRREEAAAELGKSAKPVSDYRQVLERSDIDGVIIGTPDHWHTPMILEAIAAGKDVYCEKPVTQNLAEGETLLAGVRGTDRVIATGTQQRSWDHYLKAKELVAAGELGQITFVETYWYQDYTGGIASRDEKFDLDQLDWNLWLGTRPKRAFDPMVYRRWRFFWDFGGGIFTDLLTHWIDVVQWFLDSPAPTEAQAAGATHHCDWLETPDTVTANLLFPGNFTVLYHSSMIGSLEGGGIYFRGQKASLRLTRDGFWVYPEGVVPREGTSRPAPTHQMKSTGDGTRDNVANWVDCIRTRKQPNAHLQAGVEAARTSHLANVALRERRIVKG